MVVNRMQKKTVYEFLRTKFGISKSGSNYFCRLSGLNVNSPLKYADTNLLRSVQKVRIQNSFDELEQKKFTQNCIKNKIRIRCYEGIRHLQSLPVRGQNTKTNRYTARKLNLKRAQG